MSLIPIKTHNKTSKYTEVTEQKIDTGFQFPDGWIFEKAKQFSDSLGVPRELVYEIGLNESGWRFPNDSLYVQGPDYVKREASYYDMQILNSSFNIIKNKINLKEKNRETALYACIYYLKECYIIGDSSWYKARFIYARGRWRPEYTWTKLEKRFMKKIDFSKYDKNCKKQR